MTAGSGVSWTADIPAQPSGTTIYYYVEGVSTNGKTQVRPIVAPEGYWEFDVLESLGIDDTNEVLLSDVFPNPASAITCIPLTANATQNGVITLRNITGQVVQTIHNGIIPAGESKYFFLANEFAAGSYFVVIETAETSLTKKVMIR
jgi:hypothetical protein